MAVNRMKIEDLWRSGRRAELARDLAARRTECSAHFIERAPDDPTAAAFGILTLLELGAEPGDGLLDELAADLAASQAPGGDWGGVDTTALALRALAACRKQEAAFARGLAYLATSQGPEGAWRGDRGGDFHDTALVLSLLGDLPDFVSAVDVEAAVEWYRDTRDDVVEDVPGLVEAGEHQWSVALQRVEAVPRLVD